MWWRPEMAAATGRVQMRRVACACCRRAIWVMVSPPDAWTAPTSDASRWVPKTDEIGPPTGTVMHTYGSRGAHHGDRKTLARLLASLNVQPASRTTVVTSSVVSGHRASYQALMSPSGVFQGVSEWLPAPRG